MSRCRPTREQRCTVAGWMRQTAQETIAKLQAVIDAREQTPAARCLATAHQDAYREVLAWAEREQRKWCGR